MTLDSRRSSSSVRKRAPRLKAVPGLETPNDYSANLERGDPAVAEKILELLADGPMRPSALRKAVEIRNCTHFNRYYLTPMIAKRLVERTDPAHPQSPQQKCRLA